LIGLIFSYASGWFETHNKKLASERDALTSEKHLLETEKLLVATRKDELDRQAAQSQATLDALNADVASAKRDLGLALDREAQAADRVVILTALSGLLTPEVSAAHPAAASMRDYLTADAKQRDFAIEQLSQLASSESAADNVRATCLALLHEATANGDRILEMLRLDGVRAANVKCVESLLRVADQDAIVKALSWVVQNDERDFVGLMLLAERFCSQVLELEVGDPRIDILCGIVDAAVPVVKDPKEFFLKRAMSATVIGGFSPAMASLHVIDALEASFDQEFYDACRMLLFLELDPPSGVVPLPPFESIESLEALVAWREELDADMTTAVRNEPTVALFAGKWAPLLFVHAAR
jgi:hypothetical protein